MQPIAEVGFSCGRCFLRVGGIIVAMQGDKCRDSNMPESVLPPIPAEELAHATIGGEPIADIPVQVVRFFRGDCWTEAMLKYAAERINAAAREG